jgi:GTP-binding protein YchF
MDLAIIGLERSGKTTVFNALSGGHVETGRYGAASTNIGVAQIPDERLEALGRHVNARKVTPAEVKYWDIPGVGFTKSGASQQLLAALGQADAFLHVVRVFAREDVPHPLGDIDPKRDIEAMDTELVFADLSLIEKRLQRLTTEVRAARPGEREAGQRELTMLERLKAGLEAGIPLRYQSIDAAEMQMLSTYSFLTAKPVLVVLNVGEGAVDRLVTLQSEYSEQLAEYGNRVVAICGKLETELAELPPDEAAEFRPQVGLKESGVAAALRASQELLKLITFFTAGENETRAWMVAEGTTALQAAGKIHSDIERGFIRAEVMNWRTFLEAGSIAEARKRGLVSIQGKGYIVNDGDVINILFNI